MEARSRSTLAILVAVLAAVLGFLYHKYAPDPAVGVRVYFTDRHDREPVLLNSSTLRTFPTPHGDDKLCVIVAGYTEQAISSWSIPLAQALLRRGRAGVVLLVDYYHLTTISRPAMNNNIDIVAKTLAEFFSHLANDRDFSLSRVHVLCFSMAGRVMGSMPQHLSTPQKIGRITAMDPSTPWPGYHRHLGPDELLDDGDADEVVVLRSSVVSSSLPPLARDFVINGGLLQEGCYGWHWPQFLSNICSHYRAHWLVIEALLNDGSFPACSGGAEDLANSSSRRRQHHPTAYQFPDVFYIINFWTLDMKTSHLPA
ncbi:endothelial lipase-like isoform X2 [Hyalella azteca]|nr:endothelial lipase-like isoform X2 [Hyalella azteca]XP_047738913.1 endothelial lipase-like isoform X2 [Hyalella azteca]